NRETWSLIRGLAGLPVPRPFLLAVLLQESGGRHFRTPTVDDADDFIVVGLDRNDAGRPDRITSRGYGTAQHPLFHHPPRPDEIDTLMIDPVRNVQGAIRELDEKFRTFVNGSTGATRADDRIAEFGRGPLRRCRYDAGDPRYMVDCVRCAGEHLMNVD